MSDKDFLNYSPSPLLITHKRFFIDPKSLVLHQSVERLGKSQVLVHRVFKYARTVTPKKKKKVTSTDFFLCRIGLLRSKGIMKFRSLERKET